MESTTNRALYFLGRNILISLFTLMAMFYCIGSTLSYFVLGCVVATLLAIKKLPLFNNLINPIFYIPIFFMDVVLWPTAVIARVAKAYLESTTNE